MLNMPKKAAAALAATVLFSAASAQASFAGAEKAFPITETQIANETKAYCNDRTIVQPSMTGECFQHMTPDIVAVSVLMNVCEPGEAQTKGLKGKKLAAVYDDASQCYRGFVAQNKDNAYSTVAFDLGMTATANARNAERGFKINPPQ